MIDLKDFSNRIKKEFGRFTFYEEPHIYTYKDDNGEEHQIGISTTSLIDTYTQEFDEEKWAKIKAKQMGVTVEDVKGMWQRENDISKAKGHYLHAFMENLWQGKEYMYPVDEVIAQFGTDVIAPMWNKIIPMMIRYYNKTKDRLIPLGLELVIGDVDYDIGGSIDCLFYSIKLDAIIVMDYKTNKKITYKGFNGQTMKFPLNYLQDCNYIHYSLQLSIYNHILEKHTHYKLSERRFLLWFNENNDDVEIIPCKDLTNEAKIILKIREKERKLLTN